MQSSEIPEIIDDDGTRVKVIIGSFWGKTGPVDGIAAGPQYLDVYMCPPACAKHSPSIFIGAHLHMSFEGSASFRDASAPKGVLLEKEFQGARA